MKTTALFLLLAGVFSLAPAADRVALIVGVDAYHSDSIPNLDGALRDARIMSDTLREMHSPFDVIQLEDPTLNEALDGLDQFMAKARGAQCAMFFFAGHGIEYHGENFLLTSDSDIGLDSETSVEATKRRLRRKMLSLNTVMDEIELTGSDLKLLVLDACRDNPIPAATGGGKTRSLGSTRGLARVSAPLGMLVSYSADAGQVANDGLFTEILTSNLSQPNLSVMEVFAKTREEVNDLSRQRNEADARYNVQLPAEYNKLGLKGIKFVFNDPGAATPSPTTPTAPMTPPAPASLAPRFENGAGMTLIGLPGGSFRMGDLTGGGQADELPVRQVTVAPFHIAAKETTQSQWLAATGKSIDELRRIAGFTAPPTDEKWGEGPEHPVYYVTWEEATEFCRALTESGRASGEVPPGWGYRLPTEAEWEYACRAGSTENFSGDSWEIGQVATFFGAQPAGEKKANGFGLFDMQGNVWEWCGDLYGPYSNATDNPGGPTTGSARVFRGGSWMEEEVAARPSARGFGPPGLRHRSIGFRVVLAPEN